MFFIKRRRRGIYILQHTLHPSHANNALLINTLEPMNFVVELIMPFDLIIGAIARDTGPSALQTTKSTVTADLMMNQWKIRNYVPQFVMPSKLAVCTIGQAVITSPRLEALSPWRTRS